MHAVEILSGIVGLLLGAVFGMWLAKRKQPDFEAIQAEHNAYRKDVEKHFEKTAQLAHQMAEDYRNMYQHLAQGAVSLCESEDNLQAPSLVALQRHGQKSEKDGGAELSQQMVPGARPVKPE